MNVLAKTERLLSLSLNLIFAAGLLLTFFSCAEETRTIEDRSLEKGADVKISNFYRLSLDEAGRKEWEITAGEAYIFTNKKETSQIIAYNFTFRQFSEDGKILTNINAVRGEVDYIDNKLYLTGDVKYVGSNNRIITSSKMEYDKEEQVISSTAPVTITDKTVITKCLKGIRVEQETNRQICIKPEGYYKSNKTEKSEPAFEDIFQ